MPETILMSLPSKSLAPTEVTVTVPVFMQAGNAVIDPITGGVLMTVIEFETLPAVELVQFWAVMFCLQ